MSIEYKYEYNREPTHAQMYDYKCEYKHECKCDSADMNMGTNII